MSQNWSAPPPAAAGAGGNVPNNMVIAIIATVVSIIFCCLPHGLISLIYAMQVNKKAAAGDMAGAAAAAGSAKTWGMISIVLAVIWFILAIILNLAGALSFNMGR
ncbi:MAG TPA: CD225/dispanin family protein [Pyrinomonadaceae bacterium]